VKRDARARDILVPPMLLALCATLALAQDTPTFESLPIDVEIGTSTVTDSGEFTLRLACTPREDIRRRYDLRVALSSLGDDLVAADHKLDPPTAKWNAGQRVDCAIPLTLPFDTHDLESGELISIRIAFVPDGGGAVLTLDGAWEDLGDDDGLVDVEYVEVPRFAGPLGKVRLDEVIAEARAASTAGDTGLAWQLLDEGLRDGADDATKERVRDVLAEVGKKRPAPISELEQQIIGQRIRGEQIRVFRIEAGRMYDRGELHGAVMLLEEVGGALNVNADEAVIGAVGEADRMTQRIEDIQEEIRDKISKEQEAAAKVLYDEHGRGEKLVDAADKIAKAGRYAEARWIYRRIQTHDGILLYDRAQTAFEETGDKLLEAIPEREKESVRGWIEHPVWGRTEAIASHSFIFIGPKKLIEGIPEPSKLRFDIAYVFITDLFGRIPNPDGDRITVYFKELFDFGGGVGGGKIIDIGRADPAPKRAVGVDNGLLYHELTHCVEDTIPDHGGFSEGLANLGAAYAYEALDQNSDALHSFDANLEGFERYFVARDMRYWRIQNYAPSAGFFLHFVDTYAGGKSAQHDWSPLRRFFREYRDAPVRDGREHLVVRSLGYHLGRAFGPTVFDDLVGFGFPLEESDRGILRKELDAFEGATYLEEFEEKYFEHPNSQLPRDAVEMLLTKSANREDLERSKELRRELGVIFEWKVIGPFFAKAADPGAHPFTPETSIDFTKKPRSWRASRADKTQRTWQDPLPSWRPTGSHKNVTLFPSGWLHFDYEPYGDDNSAIYALTHITLPEGVDAEAHVRADDDFVLFVNDRRVGMYKGRGTNGSSSIRGRGPSDHSPDGMRFPVRLEEGRNKVLVKIRNRGGPAGLIASFSRLDGSRLAFTDDADPPTEPGPRAPVEEPSWKRIVSLDHRTYKSKTKTVAGSWGARNKAFFGRDTDGGVPWRLFTVRPGFPKDSPSNLMWLKPALTKDLDAVRLDVTFASTSAPKMVLTIQGEGTNDGLSGWNLILVPRGNSVSARLERYDHLVYQSDPVEFTPSEEGPHLSFRYWDRWVTVTLGDEVLFYRLPVRPIAGKSQVGLATWGPDTQFRSIEISRGR